MPTAVDFASRLYSQPKAQVDFSERLKTKAVIEDQFGELGEGELIGKARFRFGMADNPQEQLLAIQQSFPEGELVRSTIKEGDRDKEVLLFRENKAVPFKRVNEEGLNWQDVAGFAGEEGGAIMGGTAATLRSKGVNLLPLIWNAFKGEAAGEIASEVVEMAAGQQEEEVTSVAGRAALKGAIGAAGTGIMAGPVAGIIDAKRGGGFLRIGDEAKGAQKALSEINEALGTDIRMLPGEASDSRIITRISGLSRDVANVIKNFERGRNVELAGAFKKLSPNVSGSDKLRFMRRLREGDQKLRDAVLAEARKTGKAGLTEGGDALKQGLNVYEQVSRKQGDELYEVARSFGEPKFDIGPAIRETEKMLAGTRGQPNPQLNQILQDLKVAQQGPKTATLEGGESIAISQTDQLRNLRSELRAMKTPLPGAQADPSMGQAGAVHRAVDDVLKHPDGDVSFRAAWAQADKFWRNRAQTLSHAAIRTVLKDEAPAKLAHRFAQPREVDSLKELRKTIPKDKFATFQNSFKQELLDNPNGMSSRLSSFDKPTLDQLLTPREQKLFRTAGREIDRINQFGVRNILEAQSSNSTVISNLIDASAGSSRTARLIRATVDKKGGVNGTLGRTVREGIMEHVWNKAVKPVKDIGLQLDKGGLQTAKESLRKSGMMGLLTPGDIRTMNNFTKVASRMVGPDAGTALVGAQVGGGVARGNIGSIFSVVRLTGIGKALVNKKFQNWLIGTGVEEMNPRFLAAIGSTLGTTVNPPDLMEEIPELQYGN